MMTLNECEDTVNELAIVEPPLAIEDYLITDEVNIQLSEVPCIDKGKQKMDTQTSIDDVDTRNYSRPVYLTGVENEDSICSTVYDSPNGTRYWTPIVRDEFKPIVGSVFAKWDDVAFMYERYAQLAGFCTRLGAMKKNKDGVITHRYMMCTKAGKPHGVVFDSLDKSPIRRTNFKVTDCKARIKVRYIKDTSSFQLYEHIENHNHGLINSDNLNLSKKKRRLNFSDKEYIAKCRLANVGPSKAHRLQVALKGGHHMVRGIKTDFKNFGRDVSVFIKKGDAQMFVNRMTERSEQLINFTFKCHCIDYEVRGLFWADDVSKKNYKVCGNVLKSSNIRSAIHKLVWNVYLDPSTFEERWKLLMEQNNLQNHEWLRYIYSIRDKWVPGYFKDIPMCCLMKTTSRCESSNSFFNVNSSGSNTLIQFLLAFDSAIDEQRFNQRLLEHSTTTTPQFRTTMNIERNANEIYTRTIFKEVQKEIYKSTTLCYISNRNIDNGLHNYCVTHQDNRCNIINEFTVNIDLKDDSVSCTCMGFTRIGYLCRHVFCVFRHHKIENIPTQYVHNRWRRVVLPRSVFSMSNRYCVDQSESSTIRNHIMDNIQQTVDRIRNDPERLALLDKEVEAIKEKIFQELPYSQINQTKNAIIQELVNVPEPSNIKYTISPGIRNKGCGTNRRLIGPWEKAIINSQKPKRKCRYCNKMVNNHDSRNCPVKKKDMEEFASTNHDTDEEEYKINADGCSDVDDKLEDSEDFEFNEDDYAFK
ncbi:hypothetical protein E3N88_21822 [Mikania micrantha]|uniref:SWIM-type domain-containing protein n=1 Tax=Mikania micrantha TaxID=192012 RepID=A0A5N6N8P3_9ASTR|nr:hypothetical protein E3N88_21822 [Mikania micrantha]